jgi:hypothetical protein
MMVTQCIVQNPLYTVHVNMNYSAAYITVIQHQLLCLVLQAAVHCAAAVAAVAVVPRLF